MASQGYQGPRTTAQYGLLTKKTLTTKGNRNKRLVIDFRMLNKQTIADRFPMPSIQMFLAIPNFLRIYI